MTDFSSRKNIQRIEALLLAAGWLIQSVDTMDFSLSLGIAVPSFPLSRGQEKIGYLLFVDRKAAGVIDVMDPPEMGHAEGKKTFQASIGWEALFEKVRRGLPFNLPVHIRPLPFFYPCSGSKILFRNGFDSSPCARRLFAFHKPDTLKGWLEEGMIGSLPRDMAAASSVEYGRRGATLQERIYINMPPLIETGLRPVQARTLRNIEHSLRENQSRTLVQMASGKTGMAISLIYRLIRYAGARRVLLLVDSDALEGQVCQELHQYVSPYTNKIFGEEFQIRFNQDGPLDPVTRVCISTPQRLYACLKGKKQARSGKIRIETSLEYHPDVPIETFDIIVVDGCSQITDSPCRDVIEYFDAFLVGLCRTRRKQIDRFFNQNLVMEYGDEPALAGDHLLRGVSFEALLQTISDGKIEEDLLGILATHLSRMVYWLSAEDEVAILNVSVVSSGLDMIDRQAQGWTLQDLGRELTEALSSRQPREREADNVSGVQIFEPEWLDIRKKKLQKAVEPFQSSKLCEILLKLNKKMVELI